MPRQHSCRGMSKILWRSLCWNRCERNTKFPSKRNCDGKTLVEWTPEHTSSVYIWLCTSRIESHYGTIFMSISLWRLWTDVYMMYMYMMYMYIITYLISSPNSSVTFSQRNITVICYTISNFTRNVSALIVFMMQHTEIIHSMFCEMLWMIICTV